MKIEIEWNEDQLIYRFRAGDRNHGTWERPISVGDFTIIGKIVDLIESSFNLRRGEQKIEEITWKLKTEEAK